MSISIYSDHLPEMEQIRDRLLEEIEAIRKDMTEQTGMDPVEHLLARIKSEESMREKCRRKGLPETTETALFVLHDAIGIRIVCSFLQDVFTMRDRLAQEYPVIEEKDYIRHAKPNGYRSLHLILRCGAYPVEIQLRTISMDTWAALEHHLKYKKTLHGNTALLAEELKRCADELASTDISMQTLRDMILEE